MANPVQWPEALPRLISAGQSISPTIAPATRVEMDIGAPRVVGRYTSSLQSVQAEAAMSGTEAEQWLAWWAQDAEHGAIDVVLPIAAQHDGGEAWWRARITTFSWAAAKGNRWLLSITLLLLAAADDAAPWVSTGAVAEDGAAMASGTMPPPGIGASIVQAIGVTALGAWSITAGGAWTYTLANGSAAVQALRGGEQVTDVVAVRSTGGRRGEIRINVSGAADVGDDVGLPWVSSAVVVEDGIQTASGVMPTLPLGGQAVPATGVTRYGAWSITAGGAWTYTLANGSAAAQALRGGEQVTDVVAVSSAAGRRGEIWITIVGTDDTTGPAGGDLAGDVIERPVEIDSGEMLWAGTDAGDSAAAVAYDVSGLYGRLRVASDRWTYLLDSRAIPVKLLAEGETLTDSFVLASYDGSAAQTVAVTVHGRNDVLLHLPCNGSWADHGDDARSAVVVDPPALTSSGLFAGAGDFAGGGLVQYPADAGDALAGDWSIEAWIKPSAYAGHEQDVISRTGGGQHGWTLRMDSASVELVVSLHNPPTSGSGTRLYNATLITPGAWHHIACSRQGDTWRLFVDGALADEQTHTGPVVDAIGIAPFELGRRQSGASMQFTGQVEEVFIYRGRCLYTAPFPPPTRPVGPALAIG